MWGPIVRHVLDVSQDSTVQSHGECAAQKRTRGVRIARAEKNGSLLAVL